MFYIKKREGWYFEGGTLSSKYNSFWSRRDFECKVINFESVSVDKIKLDPFSGVQYP